MFFKQFGGSVTEANKSQYSQSPNWKDGAFQNPEPVDLAFDMRKLPQILYKQLTSQKGQYPPAPLPIIPLDKVAFLAHAEEVKMVWYGHSVVLMRMNGKTILIDPMLGSDSSPPAPTTIKRFSENTLDLIDTFPEIDLLLMSHDHYDHLDYASIQKLKSKTKHYYVGMGVKRHLVSWGVEADLIEEFDWWQKRTFEGVEISYTQTRHFSGRGLFDRFQSLWGGWVFDNQKEKIWFSGDGGYGKHFAEVAQRFGSFDFAFMENGQYNEDWHDVHLFPHEAVQVAAETNVKKAMPVHWAGFPLSYQHTWNEPADDFVEAAEKANLAYCLPRLGELFTIKNENKVKWWESEM